MTSIPVRKGTTVNRKAGVLKENTDHNSHIETERRKNSTKENKQTHRPLIRQSSKKELENENSKLHEEIQSYEKRLKDLEASLCTTKEQLLKNKEESEAVKGTCERTLLYCNIDPVTLDKMSPDSEEENKLQHRRNKAKAQVSILQDKIQGLNTQATECIKALHEMSASLDNPDTTLAGSADTGTQQETGT